MEAKICCANNVSRGCRISSKVIVADCASTPFKLMKLMLDGLAKDAEAGFWLTGLSQTPQIVRLFPFDFVYLDGDLKIIQALELPPESKLPRFHPRAESALILPLNSLSSSGTVEGDTLSIGGNEELRLEPETVPEPVATETVPVPTIELPVASSFEGATHSTHFSLQSSPIRVADSIAASQHIPILIPAAPTQGTGHTFALAGSWQISQSTPAGVLLDSVETEEIEEIQAGIAEPEVSLTDLLELEPAIKKEDAVKLEPGVAVDELATKADAGAKGEAEEESKASRSIIEVEPEPGKASSAGFVQKGKPGTAPVTSVDGDTPMLDTDLATIFDAAIAEEFGGSVELNFPGRAVTTAESAETAPTLTLDSIQDKQAVEGVGAEIAEKELQTTAGTIETPTNNVARETKPAPSTAATNGAPKFESGDPRKTSAEEAESLAARSGNRGRKKSFGYLVKEFLNCPDPLPENRSAPRLVQHGMIAYERPGEDTLPIEVRDVSPSGLYLRTKKRWPLRKVFTLSLQKKGAGEDEFQSRVNVRVAALRSDKDGVGLAWAFPKHVTFDPWRRVHTKRSDETDIQFFIREIRLTKALGFLDEICPLSTIEIKHALLERFSNKRVASAVEITLKAEDLLEKSGRKGPVLAHSEVVMRVLENGSWIEDDWIRKLWAGLLVSSCCDDGSDKSNLPFLDLMARLTPIHLRIFAFVCKRATDAIAAGQPEAKLELYSTAKELMEAADSHSFQRIQQTVGHLCNFGLFQEVMRPSYSTPDDKMKSKTTPTALGLKMYAHCLGQRS